MEVLDMTYNPYTHHPAMTPQEAAMLKAEEKCHPIKDGIFEYGILQNHSFRQPQAAATSLGEGGEVAFPRRGAPVARRDPCLYPTCMTHVKGVERAEWPFAGFLRAEPLSGIPKGSALGQGSPEGTESPLVTGRRFE